MFPQQLTETVLLDFFSESDAPEFYRLVDRNRVYLREFLPWLDFCRAEEDSLTFIKKTTAENNTNQALTLCIREAKQIIGVICFHIFDHEQHSAGIGYWLDSAYQGKGLMTQACKFLMAYGFGELKLTQISLSCGTTNKKSKAVAERLGFSRTTLIPQKEWLYDHYVDHVRYEMTAEEWAALNVDYENHRTLVKKVTL